MLDWKGRKHKCLLVKGQRQVGKTFIIDRFARENYDHYVYLNLDESVEFRHIFDGSLAVDDIIKAMMLYVDPNEFVPGSTIIFLDEIQGCPRARSSLKNFSLDGRYDVVASGPLLGVTMPRDGSDEGPGSLVPVGYEEHLEMRSMDFEEFLWANGIPDDVISDVRSRIHNLECLDEVVLHRFDELFRDFMIVGGMPEAVQAFVDTHNYRESGRIIKSLIESCKTDINRYNKGNDRPKTLDCFNSIPSQLSESNKKFTFSRIEGDGSRSSGEKYRGNLRWIEDAGYGNFCRSLKSLNPPLLGQAVRDQFKVYLSDTGMLMHMYGDSVMRATYSGDTSYNMGAITENIIAECIRKSGFTPYYYRKANGKGMMELDFVVELPSGVAVIEVKSGKSRDAPSIRKVPSFFDVNKRIILGRTNVCRDDTDGIISCPLFAAAFLEEFDDDWDGPMFRGPFPILY